MNVQAFELLSIFIYLCRMALLLHIFHLYVIQWSTLIQLEFTGCQYVQEAIQATMEGRV